MANQVEPVLISGLYKTLQRERFVTISTVDFETGGPNVSAISWVFAPNQENIVFAVDNRSRIVQNINKNPLIVLNLLANESTYSIHGEARIKVEKLEEVPLKLALVEILVKEVRDVMFYGSKISVEPKYEKTYDKEAAVKLDRQVMEAIKKVSLGQDSPLS
jgi:nitroimidazol reductase NimA-like FMN-containing flavoprotein (pyridoxamine 5'-phosphate oxidase superfamily)